MPSAVQTFHMRYIQKEDNSEAAQIIRNVLAEFSCTGTGYACNDSETEDLYSAYQNNRSRFWVISNNKTKEIVGCGGFSQLKDTQEEEKICELQKFYFLQNSRGKGLGKKLLLATIKEAKALGYDYMYLESTPKMNQALSLYQKFGFEQIDKPMGNTGHSGNCSIYMLYNLKEKIND